MGKSAQVTTLGNEHPAHALNAQGPVYSAALALPSDPKRQGTYWGYQTRIAANLLELTEGCPFQASRTFKPSQHSSLVLL